MEFAVLGTVFLFTLLTAILLLYLSTKNQRLLNSPIAKSWRLVSAGLSLLSLLIAIDMFVGAAVVCSWLLAVMVFTALIPFTILWLFNKSS